MVPAPCSPKRRRARSMAARASLTVAATAESSSKALAVAAATTRARVVLPVPGGPHRITEDSRSASISSRSGRPGPIRWSWPTISSRVRGRSRAASGARRLSRSAAAASNRSPSTPPRLWPERPAAPGGSPLTRWFGQYQPPSTRLPSPNPVPGLPAAPHNPPHGTQRAPTRPEALTLNLPPNRCRHANPPPAGGPPGARPGGGRHASQPARKVSWPKTTMSKRGN